MCLLRLRVRPAPVPDWWRLSARGDRQGAWQGTAGMALAERQAVAVPVWLARGQFVRVRRAGTWAQSGFAALLAQRMVLSPARRFERPAEAKWQACLSA